MKLHDTNGPQISNIRVSSKGFTETVTTTRQLDYIGQFSIKVIHIPESNNKVTRRSITTGPYQYPVVVSTTELAE